MKVIDIKSARLTPCVPCVWPNGEYRWCESSIEERGYEWNGNVVGYVGNLDFDCPVSILVDNRLIIHNEPEGAVIVADENGEPFQMFWAEEVDSPSDRAFEILSHTYKKVIRNCQHYEQIGSRMALLNEIGVLRGIRYCLEFFEADYEQDPEFERLLAIQVKMVSWDRA